MLTPSPTREERLGKRHIPDWGWTAVLGILTILAFGVAFVVGDAGPFGRTFGFPGLILSIGLGGGLLARRAADLLGVVVGTVLVFEVMAVQEVALHGSFLGLLSQMLGAALIPGGFAAAIGLILLGVRRGLRRVGVGSALLRAAGAVGAFVGLAGLFVLAASTPTNAGTFRVTGDRDIVITVTGGYSTWCWVRSVTETAADVTVGAASVSLILGAQAAVGIPTDLPIHLSQPLGDRIVRNQDGRVVRQHPPPVHAINQDRAMEIALAVMVAEHPGIARENTKVMDYALEKDPAGRAAWKINIIVLDGPFASAHPTSIWLWVDAESGAVTPISRF